MNQGLSKSRLREQVGHQYCRLASIQGSKIQLIQQGINILQQYDFIAIVTLEGPFQVLGPFKSAQDGRDINNAQDCIWISKHPTYSSRLKRYITTLRIGVNDQASLSIAHCFCSLISHIVIIGGYQMLGLKHLALPTRLVKQGATGNLNNQGSQELQKNIKQKMAALLGLGQNSQFGQPVENFDRFSKALQNQGLQKNQLTQIYPIINGFQLPSSFNATNLQYLFPYLQDWIQQGVGNTPILMHGQIVKQYADNLTNQFNRQGVFRPTLCENQIYVQQGFQEYIAAVDGYNTKCKNYLGNDSQADITTQLQKIRAQTQQQKFFQNNQYYGRKIGQYIDRKQGQLTLLNEQLNDAYNISLLQKQSAKSLQSVTNNKNITQPQVNQELDKLIRRYNQKSRGANRQKLLSQFLQVFMPTLYSQAGVTDHADKQISKLAQDNQNLEKQLQNLQKKKSSKCCNIM